MLFICGVIVAILFRSIYPFIEILIYASVALLFDFFQLILGFLGDNWVYHLAIPCILTLIAGYIAYRLIKKIDWHY
ncbi:hypothetical protein ABE61_17535 [Lysinibacillus sphaericus]|nr:hypothetical protein [Lysinibacillus sphaericus]MBG9477819.1 hypothetical protein [Lysinibacillus sphaericus]MBG9593278.1 hypothetical protein [Lysinibacillus sphaericus]